MKNVILAGLLASSLLFALPAAATGLRSDVNNLEGSKYNRGFVRTEVKIEIQKHRIEILEKMCDVRRKIHSRFPKFRVPKVCDEGPIGEPSLVFSAVPNSIIEGDSTTLSWQSQNLLSCEASGGWSGEKNVSGEEEVSPTVTTEYILTCDSVEGGLEKSVLVEVLPMPDPEPTPEPDPEPELIDLCLNIDGDQVEIPEGYHQEGDDCLPDVVVPPSIDVVINEIAWMGSVVDGSSNSDAEWIELRNLGGQNVDLSGWSLSSSDGTPNINISASCSNTNIPALGTFLLVRTNPSILGVSADCVYAGALGNGGEILTLYNASSEVMDTVNGSPNWEIGGAPQKGDNSTKETAQRGDDGAWFTAAPTPGSF